MSLESRLRELEASLAALPRAEGSNAEVVLSFEGGPVAGSHGIDTRFTSDALQCFQTLVTAVAARRSRGELKSGGTFPDADAARLHISNVVHGSFGFQLEELDRPLIGSTPLADAVERSLDVLESAKRGSDTFADAIDEEGPRIRDAAAAFLDVLRKNKAAVRLVSDKHDLSFSASDVPVAVEAVKLVRIVDDDEILLGTFGGVLLEAHRFEHTANGSDKPIYGTVDPTLDWKALQVWQGKQCNAWLRITRTFVGDVPKKRAVYVLLGIEPPSPA